MKKEIELPKEFKINDPSPFVSPTEAITKLHKDLYDGWVKAGFTEAQAMELIKLFVGKGK